MTFKTIVKIYGACTILTSAIIFIQAFFTAYMNTSKSVTIYINQPYEANFELTLILIAIPCMIYTIYDEVKDEIKRIFGKNQC